MFGLMRPEKSCSTKSNADYNFHRMHYCGTCKTLGQQYGHHTRLLLNFDTVFFSELLSHLSEENLSEWQNGFQAINRCFSMPDQAKDQPLSLQYAAATNLFLSELKVDDNILDTGGYKWKVLRRVFSKSFRKVGQQFKSWGVDTNEFWHWIKEQSKLEKAKPKDFNSVEELFTHFAEPTAQMTALVFEKGAKVVDRPEIGKAMARLGYQFGQLIYALDAFEDVEKDISKGQFNPLVNHFNAKQSLHAHQFDLARQSILEFQNHVCQRIAELSLSDQIAEQYSSRLQSNIALRVYKERQLPKTAKEVLVSSSDSLISGLRRGLSILTGKASYHLVSIILFALPPVVGPLSEAEKNGFYKWIVFFTATLASIGLFRHAFLLWKKQQSNRKKGKKGKKQSFFQGIKNALVNRNDCWSACFASCCQACCESCCESLCDSAADACCESVCDGQAWPWWVLLGVVCVTLALLLIFL